MAQRKCIWILVFLTVSVMVKAQQDPHFSQNMYNHMTVNPGFAGVRGNWVVSGIYRNQWQKMDGAPETYALNVDAPLRIKSADGGIGINLMSDKLGMQTNLFVMLNYAYKHTFDFGTLSAGVKIGVINSKIEGDYYIPGGDGYVPPEDDEALNGPNADVSKILFNSGIGAFLYGKQYYAGVSVAHLTKSKMRIGLTGEFFWAPHMYVTGGYTLNISPKMDIQPSVFIATDFISSQYNLNANMVYSKKYWAGVSYRYEEAVSFMGGVELKGGLMAGYSYDWNIGRVGKYIGGSHEITLSYNFGLDIGKREKVYKSVRFL